VRHEQTQRGVVNVEPMAVLLVLGGLLVPNTMRGLVVVHGIVRIT
jgi:hypothetical protein